MTYDEWCKQYPCLQAKTKPLNYDGVYSSRPSAEGHAEKLEQIEDIGTTFRVVEFESQFYVVDRTTAEELVGSSDI